MSTYFNASRPRPGNLSGGQRSQPMQQHVLGQSRISSGSSFYGRSSYDNNSSGRISVLFASQNAPKAPKTDFKTIIHAHVFIENSQYVNLAPELVYSTLRKKEKKEEEFLQYDDSLREHLHLRHCKFDFGDCPICDAGFVEAVEKKLSERPKVIKMPSVFYMPIVRNNLPYVSQPEPLQPFTEFDGSVFDSPLQDRDQNRVRSQKNDWTSDRPCRFFAESGQCKYGISCRFSH